MGTSSLGKINARGTITALSMLMSTIGVLTILGFISSILQDEAIQLVLNWTPSAEVPNQPSLILIYLERFGIIMTGLILFVGIFFMGIGWKIRKGHIRTANWASMTLMWLAIGMLAFMMLTTF
jgi:hypothetical protein